MLNGASVFTLTNPKHANAGELEINGPVVPCWKRVVICANETSKTQFPS
jgi:hypothetical protein